MTETKHLALPYLAAAQAQKHVTHNEALSRLDVVVQLAVLDTTATAPPASPDEGDRHIIASGATDAWEDHDGEIAAFVDGAWTFTAAGPGWIAFDDASQAVLVRHGGEWVAIGTFLGPVERLAVNVAADDTSRLAVRAEAALFTAVAAGEGGTGDMRLVTNKEASGDTASLLFQSGFSGRAEIGLAGDDDLVFKVSDTGASWIEAIRVDRGSGVPSVRYDGSDSGLAATTLHAAIDEIADSAVLGPASVPDGAPVLFDGTTGRLVKETTFGTFKSALGLGSVLDVPQREKLTAHRTYYVRTDGDDGNDGLSDTAGGAFETIQKAIDIAAALDLSIYSVTIQVGAGTYAAGNVLKSFVGAGTITIRGDTSTPANVVINPTSATCFGADGVVGAYAIRGFKLQTTTSGNCIVASNGSIVRVGEIAFGAVSANNYHMQAATQGRLSTLTGYAVSGGGFAHMGAETGGLIVNVNKTVVLTGTFAFHGSSGGFAYAGLGGGIYCNNTWDISAATVTGKRYNASMNAWINTLGGGASFFPGDVGGTTATGGQYQ